MTEDYRVEALGDCALILRARSAQPDRDWIAERGRWLRAGCPGLLDAVPTADALALHFDINWVASLATPLAEVLPQLLTTLPAATESAPATLREHRIPVCYGGEHGPDLAEAAARLGISGDTLVERHLAGQYRVCMLGFLPGFAYLDGLASELRLPRRARPRASVPAGSVAIGGQYTGIYPRRSPGGWQLIGRTPLGLFDPSREPPCRLLPGDQVRFLAIDADAFERLQLQPESAAWR